MTARTRPTPGLVTVQVTFCARVGSSRVGVPPMVCNLAVGDDLRPRLLSYAESFLLTHTGVADLIDTAHWCGPKTATEHNPLIHIRRHDVEIVGLVEVLATRKEVRVGAALEAATGWVTVPVPRLLP